VKIKAATIRFSSGTTARAKGIIVSHASLLERAKTYCEALSLKKDDAVLWLRPMGRSEILAFLLHGTTIVIGDAMAADFLVGLIRQYGVTRIYGAPLFYRTMLNEKDITADKLRNVRHFLSGGSALSKQIADGFAASYAREIVQHYGLAECSTVLMNLSQDPGKRGSVGLPVRAEVKLASEDGSPLEGEASGELWVRGPGMFDAYYKPWRLREEVLKDGWFRTGDLARRDADGYYWIMGRVKDVINVGGTKVFPAEIEEVLLTHPAVEEVMVYGVAEGRFGEVPHAKVKLRAGATCTEREIMRHVNEKVSVFKSLRAVQFVDEIPKTVTGKPRRTVLES
jgi:acyl-coenzyme A synthetase/AMP-(fatty) acid ligase